MLKLFSSPEQPTSFHTRSNTSSYLRSSSIESDGLLRNTTTVNGLHFNFMAPTEVTPDLLTLHQPCSGDPVAEPRKLHQRSYTEQIRVHRDLPPLFTKSSEPSLQDPTKPLELPRLSSSPQRSDSQRSTEQSRRSSPTRSNRLMTSNCAGDHTTQGRVEEKVGKFADWFKGESAPISIGILSSPVKEKANCLETTGSSSEIRPSNFLQRKSTSQGTSKPVMASRFSFFSSKASLPKSASRPLDGNDEYLDMDVNKALFPAGPADHSSPAAFKNLQQQAEVLLLRLQIAYQERTLQLREMAAEKEALAEETEGAETRARHLKMQLGDISVKLAEQDEAMMNLVDQLAQEKLARREEGDTTKQTIRLVETGLKETKRAPDSAHRRFSRANTVSDSGFESEYDSSSESVFSRQNAAHSPSMSMSSVSTTNSADAYQSPDLHLPTSAACPARLKIPNSQLAIKGMPAPHREDVNEEPNCPKCHGVRALEAWGVIGVLKEENQGLKHRVEELEGALDGCLDVVDRLS